LFIDNFFLFKDILKKILYYNLLYKKKKNNKKIIYFVIYLNGKEEKNILNQIKQTIKYFIITTNI